MGRQSKAAADSIEAHVSRLAEIAFSIVSREFGATIQEVSELAPMGYTTASARIRELTMKGRIEDSGGRRGPDRGATPSCG